MTANPFEPTHTAPPEGLSTWSKPDPALAPDNRLGPGLPVQLLEEKIGWGHVRCSNGWETWVDARLLVALPAPTLAPSPEAAAPTPPPPPPPPTEPEPPAAADPEFAPSHSVPATGLATRDRPDPERKPNHRLNAGLPVHVIERAGDWARVRCSNGWETWVDGRNLAARD